LSVNIWNGSKVTAVKVC